MLPTDSAGRMIPVLGAKPSPAREALPERLGIRVAKVLLVDEALAIRRKLTEILHRSGIAASELLVATDAEKAIETFALEHPSLVFCELVGEDAEAGLDMVAEMLHIDPQVRIVLVTAEDPEGAIVRRAVRLGVFAVVRKPLRHEKIRQVLSEIEAEEGGIERFR